VLSAEEAAGLKALHAIANSGHELLAVLTSPSPEERRGSSVFEVARKLGYEVWPAARVKDASLGTTLRSMRTDLLVNIHSLYIVHGDVVAAPRIGSFNLHPGPLPEYAGLNAPSWAVYHRESSHAVTLHWMAPGIDTGEIAYEARFPVTDADTGLTVSTNCVKHGIPLVARLLEDAAKGQIPKRPQDLARRRVFRRRDVPHGGRIDWALGATEIDAFVRAADYYPMPSPWGHPVATLRGREVEVARVERTGRAPDAAPGTVRGIEVATADGWLILRRLRVDGRYVEPSAFLGGVS
jgi:UDP-4-amino-4-deoxy-L-arabinose formyltransferase/UDP-glucuronic acid dehydrogenase (UDP-4-keto-hexauronic acid decarboxylating)